MIISLGLEKRNSILISTGYLVLYKNMDNTCNIIIFPDPYFSLFGQPLLFGVKGYQAKL